MPQRVSIPFHVAIVAWTLYYYSSSSSILPTTILFIHAAAGVFVNWNKSPNVGGPYENLFQPQNDGQVGVDIQTTEFQSGLQQLMDIVDEALSNNKRIRAYGSKWSTTNVAYTNDYLVETWGLNYYTQLDTHDKNQVLDTTTKSHNDDDDDRTAASRLVFVQAGVMIKHLNEALLQAGLALPTTGSGDGQRIVGATATGTHGSANQFGAMPDFVKAIHVVLANQEHAVIQRSSDPVVTKDFVDWLGSGGRLIQDDDMFNAAVVGLGSFGLFHGVVIEAEPLYQLKCQNHQRSYAEVKSAVNTLDASRLNLEVGGDTTPYHLTILLNPYRLDDSPKGAFIDACEKITDDMDSSSSENEQQIDDPVKVTLSPVEYSTRNRAKTTRSIDGFFNDWINSIPDECFFDVCATFKRLVYGNALQDRLTASRQPYSSPRSQYPSEWFTFEGSDDPVRDGIVNVNAEFAVPLDRTVETLDTLIAALNEAPLPTSLEIRFVKKSQAMLAFTQYADVTTSIALSVPFFDGVFASLEKLFDTMADSGIPHSYHWGKHHPQNSKWVPVSYGSALTAWQNQRNALLSSSDARLLNTFTNDWLETLGMA